MKLPKLIAILGPTASGKSALGIALAQKFAGEIISADSRQVYRGLDIGAGKINPEEQALIPHHLLDIVEAREDFSVARFQKLAFQAIDDIHGRDKIPFLVGGTALYAYAVVDNYAFTAVPSDPERKKELEGKTVEELRQIFESLKPPPGLPLEGGGVYTSPPSQGGVRGGFEEPHLNAFDYQNPRRLIRAIEKLEAGMTLAPKKGPQKYDSLLLAIDVPREELYKKIDSRVDERLARGMIEEVEALRKRGVSDAWLISLGLEYRYITRYLQDKCWPKASQPLAEKREEMISRLKGAIHNFARRQLTWWRRDRRLVWVRSHEEAERAINKFL